jgi:hypothetical protein
LYAARQTNAYQNKISHEKNEIYNKNNQSIIIKYNMPEIIFGWSGKESIYNVLKQEFPEKDQQKMYHIIYFKIETTYKGKDGPKNIKPKTGINPWTVENYQENVHNKTKNIVTFLYGINYSAYQKIYTLQKYIDVINCKYAVNLKINFHYDPSKPKNNYTFILYFEKPSTNQIDIQTIDTYMKQWQRIKQLFIIEPKIHNFL